MANGPGGHEVERLSVKVVPDTSTFAKDLKAYLQREERSTSLKINVELDTKAAEAKLKELAKNLAVTLKVNIDAKGVKTQLASLSKNQTAKIKANVDDTKAKANLAELQKDVQKRILAKLDDTTVQARIDKLQRPVNKQINAILKVAKDSAKIEIASLTRDRTVKIATDVDDLKAKIELAVLARDRHVNIKADVDKSFISRIGGVLGKVSGLIGSAFSKAGDVMGQAFDQASSAVSNTTNGIASMGTKMQAVGQAFVIVIYAVIIPALVGVVIAAAAVAGALLLAFAPAIFIAAGVAFLTLSAKGKGTAQKLKNAFNDVKKTAKSVISDAIKPMTDAIQAQVPKLDKWIKTLKGPLKDAFTASSKYVDDFRVGFQNSITNMFKGLTNALNNPALKPAIDGFEKLMGKIGTALGLFFLVLANSGVDFGKTLNAVGDALIKIAPALANMLGAFAKVSPDLITRMGDGIAKILKAFSDPNTVASLAILANISFDTIIFSLQALAFLIAGISLIWEGLKIDTKKAADFISQQWNSLGKNLDGTWNALKAAASATWNYITRQVSTSCSAVASVISSIWNGIRSYFSSTWNSIKSIVSFAVRAIASDVTSKWNALKSITSSTIGAIKSFFSGLASYVTSTIDSISQAINWIIGRAKDAANWLSRINPFGADSTISVKDETDGAARRPFNPGLPPVAPMPMGGSLFDFQGSLTSMQSAARNLNNTAFSSASKNTGLSAGVKGLAQKIYQFGDIIASDQPSEESIIKALSYADALYAS